MTRQFSGERIVFSTHGAGTTAYSHAKESSWTPSSNHSQKIKLKWIIDQNVIPNTVQLLEKNVMVVNFYDLRFLDMIPEHQ